MRQRDISSSESENDEEVMTTDQIIEDSDSDSEVMQMFLYRKDDFLESLSIDGLESIFIILGSRDLSPQQLQRLWNFYDRQRKGALYKSDLSSTPHFL